VLTEEVTLLDGVPDADELGEPLSETLGDPDREILTDVVGEDVGV